MLKIMSHFVERLGLLLLGIVVGVMVVYAIATVYLLFSIFIGN